MKLLLIDIVRTTLDDVWPTVEYSLGLMYLISSLDMDIQSRINPRIWTFVSRDTFSERDRNQLLKQLEDFRPDLVGIRCLSIGQDTLHAVLPVIKEWNRECFLMVGGPHATDNPEDVLRGGYVDCVVIGEGEVTFQKLMFRLLDQKPISDVPGIAFSKNGKVVKTSPQALISNLDTLPFPDYSLIDLEQFSNRFMTFSSRIFRPHGNILTTRGCPYKCMYCHNILGKKFRARTPENVLLEIQHLHDKFGLTDFQIIDDVFNLDLRRAKAICDLIIKSGMDLTLSFPNGVRGDIMDEELIDKMAMAGTKFISYAIETASPRIQKLIKKNLKLEKVFKAIEYTANAGVITRGFFMLGFPTETEEEVNQTLEFANASSLNGATFFTVVYFPGTELYSLAQSLGYFKEKEFEVKREYVQVGDGPYEFSLEKLIELKKKGISEFAFNRERIEKALQLLPSYYNRREIDGFFMSYVVSSQASPEEIKDEYTKKLLHRYFVVAERFSKKGEFYV